MFVWFLIGLSPNAYKGSKPLHLIILGGYIGVQIGSTVGGQIGQLLCQMIGQLGQQNVASGLANCVQKDAANVAN